MAIIEDDIKLIVGGHFTFAALGMDVYQETLKRVKVQAPAYLQKFAEMFLGLAFDAVAQSNLYLPSFLEIVADADPRAREVAATLLRQYDAVLLLFDAASDRHALLAQVPDDTRNLIQRLDTRRVELRSLVAGRR